MHLTKGQAVTLLKKMKKLAKLELLGSPFSNGEENLEARFNSDKEGFISYEANGVTLRIRHDDDNLQFYLRGPSGKMEGYYKVPAPAFKLFSKPWRLWVNLRNPIIKHQKNEDKLRAKKIKEHQLEAFNRVYHDTFQDDINNILLDNLENTDV